MPDASDSDAISPGEVSVLIVDDDYSIREVMREMLELEGYHVSTASDGLEGLAKLRNLSTPRIVLLDMVMPVMDGRKFLDAMISDSFLALVPVLVISATAGDIDCQGAKGVLKKPVNIEALLHAIQDFTTKPS